MNKHLSHLAKQNQEQVCVLLGARLGAVLVLTQANSRLGVES